MQANSSRNGASNAVSSISIAETDLKEAVEVPVQKAAEEEENPAEELTEAPSCPLPDVSTTRTHVALLHPLGLLPESIRHANEIRSPCDSIQCTDNSTTLRHMVLGDARQWKKIQERVIVQQLNSLYTVVFKVVLTHIQL